MALKRLKTKKSKRLTGKQKYKIEKKVREHNRKVRRTKKDSARKGKKQKLIQIPNNCPFKEDILKEVEVIKKQLEVERIKRVETFKNEQIKCNSLQELSKGAELRGITAENEHKKVVLDKTQYKPTTTKEQSLKQYFKEFKMVLDNADVVLEVVDARDPLGTRCPEVEVAVRSSPGNKRLVLILNKADLVPKENLLKWIKYFRQFSPVTPFKASTQMQSTKLGRRKFNQIKNEKLMQSSVCIGAENLMSMLGNYCRNKGIKSSLSVGVVGIPNVGKSSIINSLTRGKSCAVGSVPGITRVMQEIELDSKIKLIDCPGIVFSKNMKLDNTQLALKNAQSIVDVKDPFSVAESILKRASKEYFCELYDITEYETSEEFFAKKAARMGKFLKKGIPDITTAARSLINDWNTGKIKYCTQPPQPEDLSKEHISASIVHDDVCEFELENFEASQNIEVLDKFPKSKDHCIEMKTSRLDENAVEEIDVYSSIIDESESQPKNKRRKLKCDEKKDKEFALNQLKGNQQLNKNAKDQQKQLKKKRARDTRKMSEITDVLESFNLKY